MRPGRKYRARGGGDEYPSDIVWEAAVITPYHLPKALSRGLRKVLEEEHFYPAVVCFVVYGWSMSAVCYCSRLSLRVRSGGCFFSIGKRYERVAPCSSSFWGWLVLRYEPVEMYVFLD